ncbi:MAG TPA: sigma 54-interacting transcriptional regulator [Polyangia bacterium]|nr:sigma 54-interacting transcriptional regulator [Polyangia bacterium]
MSRVGAPKEGEGGALHVTAMGPNLFLTTPLPLAGALTIGRDEDADIRLVDESASRMHAKLYVGESSQLFIEDLGTRNGTFLREARIAPNQRVAFQPGEAINIGFTIVMVQRRRPAPQTRRFRSHSGFEDRLQEACEQGQSNGATFAVARIKAEGGDPNGQVADRIVPALRSGDMLAQYAPGDYEILLPDTSHERAHAIADDLRRRLGADPVASRMSLALYPLDGRTPDALIGRLDAGLNGSEGDDDGADAPVARSEAMRKLHRMAARAAAGETADGLISVLIHGESGVGKDVLARWIHAKSPRVDGPFVAVNCGSLTESLLSSELFGHEKGAFTDAKAAKAGLLETAAGGTVFLDEIGDMPLPLQVRILHAIENRRITRVGDVRERAIDVRFLAATHRDLEAMVEEGSFRQDLYYRLNQISLTVPPLRERPDEIEALARHFLAKAGGAAGAKRRVPRLSAEAVDILRSYFWPGNVRELRNMISRALVLCDGQEITAEHLDVEKMRTARLVDGPTVIAPARAAAAAAPSNLTPAQAIERDRIVQVLNECVGSQTAAAKQLGISRGTLIERMKRYGIPRPRAR